MFPQGVYPASVTPIGADGRPDTLSLARLLAFFESTGCQGAVIAGTNGEGPSLSAPTKRDLLRDAIKAKGNLKIILGIASTSLEEAQWLCKQAGKAGADGCLVMAPGYFREAGLGEIERWFDSVLIASPVPVLTYNFPQRTGFTFTPEMLQRWSTFDQFAGVKDSSGNRENLENYQVGPGRVRFVGDETLLPDALAAGWSGSISGVANVIPEWIVRLVSRHPDPEGAALAIPVIRELRSLPQPSTHKGVLTGMGILESDAVLPPLASADQHHVHYAQALLRDKLGVQSGKS